MGSRDLGESLHEDRTDSEVRRDQYAGIRETHSQGFDLFETFGSEAAGPDNTGDAMLEPEGDIRDDRLRRGEVHKYSGSGGEKFFQRVPQIKGARQSHTRRGVDGIDDRPTHSATRPKDGNRNRFGHGRRLPSRYGVERVRRVERTDNCQSEWLA